MRDSLSRIIFEGCDVMKQAPPRVGVGTNSEVTKPDVIGFGGTDEGETRVRTRLYIDSEELITVAGGGMPTKAVRARTSHNRKRLSGKERRQIVLRTATQASPPN
jgi:hypothetical protein